MKANNLTVIVFCLLFAGSCIWLDKKATENNTSENKPSTEIPQIVIQPNDLQYLGAFRLPDDNQNVIKSWAWGGYGLTHNPNGDSQNKDNYPGSLFGTGHAWQHQISEITIPPPVISENKNVNDLNTADILQPFKDIFKVGNWELPRVGLSYLEKQGSQKTEKLYLCWGGHLVEGPHLTHAWCETDLSNPNRKGDWFLGTDHQEYSTNEYLFEIPGNWAEKYTESKILATGRFRDGGWSGQGPSLFAIGPWQDGSPPPDETRIGYKKLLLYSSSADHSNSTHTMKDYHHSDEWNDGLWLSTEKKAAVVFVGTKGEGECWYGFSNGVVWEEPYPSIPEYPHDDRGWWSTEFKAQIIFYNPADLAKVAEGTKESWEPQPYAMLDLGEYLYNGDFQSYQMNDGFEKVQRKYRLGACGFDRSNGFLYIFELFADSEKPVIHVWQVN